MKYGFIESKFDGTEKKFETITSVPSKYSYLDKLPSVLNQGSDPTCVPCSLEAFIDWRINLKDGKIVNNKIDIKKLFEKAGGTRDGMTFKDALHYLKHEGIQTNKGTFKIDKYATIGSIKALQCAIVMNGPCVGGLPVKASSSTNFWNGYSLEGGHAIAIIGYDETGLIIRNSWGPYYGNNGYAHLDYDDFSNFYEIWTLMV